MTTQAIAVAIIVPLCTLYAIWNLLGTAGRRRVGAWLAKLPWPAPLQRRLIEPAADASACGCDGCDNGAGAKADEPMQSIVRVHRRQN